MGSIFLYVGIIVDAEREITHSTTLSSHIRINIWIRCHRCFYSYFLICASQIGTTIITGIYQLTMFIIRIKLKLSHIIIVSEQFIINFSFAWSHHVQLFSVIKFWTLRSVNFGLHVLPIVVDVNVWFKENVVDGVIWRSVELIS